METINNNTPYLINVDHISKSFQKTEVLKDVTLKVKPKEVAVIIGPSGSGKSTLLRCINGLEMPTKGTITFDNIPLNSEENLNKVRVEVGMVFQRFNLFPHMSVINNIMLAPMKIRKMSRDEAYERGIALLDKVGLKDKATSMPSQLSGGQQQRVAIARAIAKNPQLLLCDEPTGALDYKTGKNILNILKEYCKNEKRTVIIITHNSSIAQAADKVIEIYDAKVKKVFVNQSPKNIDEIEW